MRDYYAILGVKPGATPQEIKRAYRHLARLHHPDLNKTAMDDHIKRLNEAYEVLRDPARRTAYDSQLAQSRQRAAQASRQQAQTKSEPEMTWFEGMVGFVNELKKGLKDE